MNKRKGRQSRPFVIITFVTIPTQRKGFCDLSRSVARSVLNAREHARRTQGAKDKRLYLGWGSGVIIGPGPAGRGLPATGTEVPSPRLGTTGSS
jgi:hypothetical protein